MFIPVVSATSGASYSGTINTDVSAGGSALVAVNDQTFAPAPPPAIANAIVYLGMSLSNAATFTTATTPALGFMFNLPATASGQYYLAFYDPTQPSPAWNMTWSGSITSTTATLNFNYTTQITLQANQAYWWCLY